MTSKFPNVLNAAERNDELRRAIIQKAFGSSVKVKGSLRIDSPQPMGATERQSLLQRVLEHGTHRGDVFSDDDHTSATMRHGGGFVFVGDSLVVTA